MFLFFEFKSTKWRKPKGIRDMSILPSNATLSPEKLECLGIMINNFDRSRLILPSIT